MRLPQTFYIFCLALFYRPQAVRMDAQPRFLQIDLPNAKKISLIESPFDSTQAIRGAILAGAWHEVYNKTLYDKTQRGYRLLAYDAERQPDQAVPGGDLPADVGICADLAVRALRAAGYDLQQLIYEDALANPSAYHFNERFGQNKPDLNIDHRRVSNQLIFLQRNAQSLTTTFDASTLADWLPGDIVIWDFDPADQPPDHVGIVADVMSADGARPLVIQNNGRTQPTDCLNRPTWKIVGHFRLTQWPPDLLAAIRQAHGNLVVR